MSVNNFTAWFTGFTGHAAPRDWQSELAAAPGCRDRLVRVPTGLGKTEGVLAAWSFHRLHHADDTWPRRLVWCLPMRVLVEQTAEVARALAARVPEAQRPGVYVAMGGEGAGDWFLHPERPAIVVGTQDMLLSRALNRGYASARARWPVEFGLLNHDALWVMDEVQLMDVGLATSAQLQSFRETDRAKGLRPCHTWWMSATLQPEWLRTVDAAAHHANWVREPCGVPAARRTGGLWEVPKALATASIGPDDAAALARRVLDAHAELADGEFGRITLVVCNTVARACETFDALRAAGRTGDLELVHGRFRPHERAAWRERFLSRAACAPGADRIVVATQVVEAGVDISAGCLVTELAPWPSLVQRFGRCARYGGRGTVLVANRGREVAAPYDPRELESAWAALQQLAERGVGIEALEAHEEALAADERARLYPYAPAHLLLRREFDELFDTTPDLTGADVDVSRFIRSGDERDLHAFWLNVPKAKKGEKPPRPADERQPQQHELCAVPFLTAREWLCEKDKSKLKASKRAWVWDWLDGEWVPTTREALLPGRVVCVAADAGGYSIERGFDPNSQAAVTEVPREQPAGARTDSDDTRAEQEARSFTDWKTVACHTAEVTAAVNELTAAVQLPPELARVLELAARFHDWGKAHPAFQNMLFHKREKIEGLRAWAMAKAAKTVPPVKARYFAGANESDERRGFRHELASALGLFALLRAYRPEHPALLGPWVEVLPQIGKTLPAAEPAPNSPLLAQLLACSARDFDLLAYLVASHHGKVRVTLHAAPTDQVYRDRDGRGLPIRGVREGDHLPAIALVAGEPELPAVALALSPATLGLSPTTGISWRERCSGVLDRFGPAALAYLEALLRAADVRASQLTTGDPALAKEVTP